MKQADHAHPCGFRLVRMLDKGWGEMAFEYQWDSTGGRKVEDGSLPDLEHCFLYEVTTYADNSGCYRDGYLFPPDPPFVEWRFRDPTDGRTAPVALGRFPATQGWAWDRHKLGGRLALPDSGEDFFSIVALQQYRFHCEICGQDSLLCGPHRIERRFYRKQPQTGVTGDGEEWRYLFTKHNACAFMDISRSGYVADSANIGFGPVE